ncbi:hypothetical protein NE236_25135 [Actinoallomurus purpureus]|uniref:hypothetical protein n=1 Tax=Actinoallomurus purpureus TaxID=478114 RepID=UPI002092F7D6|nr:hypothetical protein [Actinoallomurus purpureus]MCO6008266.1 hypothetical protein [Actinoallomurus purpureus]
MAVEWWTRVNQGFSIADLLRAVAAVLDDIGFPGIELAPSPEDATGQVIGSGRADIEIRISTTDRKHSNTVSFQDFGDPDDPELGGWITVTPWRDNLSIVLSIATIIAAAKLTKSPVVDESQLLGGRQQDPEDLIEAIKQHSIEQAVPPAEKAQSLLRSFQPGLLIVGQ